MTDEIVAAGQAAWQRVKQARPQYDDWILIGRCLSIARAAALKAAGTNKPYGARYMRAMADWLSSHGLDDIEVQERRGAIWMVENEAELARWRKGLTSAEIRNCNHPSTILRHYRAGTRPQPRGPKKGAPAVRHTAKTANGTYPPRHRASQDLIRMFWTALRETGSNDYAVLAAVAARLHLDLISKDRAPARFFAEPAAAAAMHAG